MFHNLFDSHTHSENSPDGKHSVTFMVENAYQRGLQGLSVTDHFECDCWEEDAYLMRQKQSSLDVAKTRAAFRNRLILTHGIELGNPHHSYTVAQDVLCSQRFDFVLASLHRMRDWKNFYDLDYAKLSASDVHGMIRQYFTELLEIVSWGNFDSLAHFTLPVRYLVNRCGIPIDFYRYQEQIDEILRLLAHTGRALEINTSGLRSRLQETLPPKWIIQRFQRWGGEKVTIGSDAHSALDIGEGIAAAMQQLQSLGMQYFAFYRSRKPVMLKII